MQGKKTKVLEKGHAAKATAINVVALHDLTPGDARCYLWEALKLLKQPQSVPKALEIDGEYAQDINLITNKL